MSDGPAGPRPGARRWLWTTLRLAVGVGALTWTLSRVPLDGVARAAARIGPGSGALAIVATLVGVAVATERWRLVLHALGATAVPGRGLLFRTNLAGLFYNTYLPGAVGGELVRGWATRGAFPAGSLGGLVAVFVERVFGLTGLLLLASLVLLVHPIGGVRHLPLLAAGGLALAALAATLPALGPRLAPRAPARLRPLLETLPAPRRAWLFAPVLALSLGTQGLAAVTGHVLVVAVAPDVAFLDSLVLVPVALVATYFPFTQAGLGVREAAFVALFTRVGVDAASATAASLAVLLTQLVVAGLGGLVGPRIPERGR